MPSPILSTIVLNWNRKDLLERTLQSYLSTVSVEFELIVVDNASSDGSQSLVQEFSRKYPQIRSIFLERNLGGEAINLGIEQAHGEIIHISENDIEYLPGWAEKVFALFRAFPDLGQLSPFGPVPTDEEVWEIKPSTLRYAADQIVYEAHANVGTTSFIRRAIWGQGARFGSINKGEGDRFQFPNDGDFSHKVKALGYIVAWSDHYLVRNIGHTYQEFEKRGDYYKQNYASKDWLGMEGFENRIRTWKLMPKPIRFSHLFPNQKISPEKTSPREDCHQPQLWSMFDSASSEVETVEFLYGLTRLIKPEYCVETGTWRGHSADSIARALAANGLGLLDTIELDHERANFSRERLASIVDHVNVRIGTSLEFRPTRPIDLIFLDSDPSISLREFEHFRSYLAPGALVIFQNSRINDRQLEKTLTPYIRAGVLQSLNFATPRGLLVCQLAGSSFYRLRLAWGFLCSSLAARPRYSTFVQRFLKY
jgi:predicted O-methyltransferase YrrM